VHIVSAGNRSISTLSKMIGHIARYHFFLKLPLSCASGHRTPRSTVTWLAVDSWITGNNNAAFYSQSQLTFI